MPSNLRQQQMDGARHSHRGIGFFTRLTVGVSAALLAISGATQENALDTETLPDQQLVFGVSPAAQTQRLLSPLLGTLREELLGLYAALGLSLIHI